MACGSQGSSPVGNAPHDNAAPTFGSGGGTGPVAIVHIGDRAGPTPTQPVDQAEAAAWLCETQATALEQLMPRIPAGDTDLHTRADRVLTWFHNKCSPDSAGRDAEWVALFHELNALPIPTPVIARVGAVSSSN